MPPRGLTNRAFQETLIGFGLKVGDLRPCELMPEKIQHYFGWIDANQRPAGHRLGRHIEQHTGPAADFEDARLGLEVELVNQPTSALRFLRT